MGDGDRLAFRNALRNGVLAGRLVGRLTREVSVFVVTTGNESIVGVLSALKTDRGAFGRSREPREPPTLLVLLCDRTVPPLLLIVPVTGPLFVEFHPSLFARETSSTMDIKLVPGSRIPLAGVLERRSALIVPDLCLLSGATRAF